MVVGVIVVDIVASLDVLVTAAKEDGTEVAFEGAVVAEGVSLAVTA